MMALLRFTINCCLLAMVLVISVGAQTKPKICDLCQCSPKDSENVQSVDCMCNEKFKKLYTTKDNMKGLDHIKTFSVSQCESLTFNKDSFTSSHDLSILTIAHVDSVIFPVGVFSSLNRLRIEDVQDLRFEEKAFLGVTDITEISIRRTKIREFTTYALFRTNGLKRFELSDVVIGVIREEAFDVTMTSPSTFIIDGCTVEDIERNAIHLKTDLLLIKNSFLKGSAPLAINISVMGEAEISGSRFGDDFFENGITVISNNIQINNNSFNLLPIGLLKSQEITQGSIKFLSNAISNFSLDSRRLDLSAIDFRYNKLFCNCELAKSILAYQAIIPTNTKRLMENNYCESTCPMLTLKTLSDEIHAVCGNAGGIDVDFLCNKTTSFKSEEGTVDVSSRLGKNFDLYDDSQDTTIEKPESEHQHGHHDSDFKSAGMRTGLHDLVHAFLFIVVIADYLNANFN